MREPIGEETLRRVARMDRVTAWMAERVLAQCGRRVMEVGAGMGTFTRLLLPERERVVAVEPNMDHADTLRELQADGANLNVIEADFTLSDCRTLAREKCDTIVCLNVLEHIADDRRALENMHHVLAPGGCLILLVPALRGLFGTLDTFLYHHRRYEFEELKDKLLEAGFYPETLEYMNLFGLFGWWWNAKILRRRILPSGQLLLYNRLFPVFRLIENLSGPPLGLSLWAVARKDGK